MDATKTLNIEYRASSVRPSDERLDAAVQRAAEQRGGKAAGWSGGQAHRNRRGSTVFDYVLHVQVPRTLYAARLTSVHTGRVVYLLPDVTTHTRGDRYHASTLDGARKMANAETAARYGKRWASSAYAVDVVAVEHLNGEWTEVTR